MIVLLWPCLGPLSITMSWRPNNSFLLVEIGWRSGLLRKVPNQSAPQFVQGNRGGNNVLLTYLRVWVFLAGIPPAVEILNSIESSLENVLTSVVSSYNDTVVPDSTNSNMVVIEMPSLALPAWPQQELCCWYKNMCVWKKIYSQYPNGYES